MNFALVKIDMWKGEGNCLAQRRAGLPPEK
jgi:hypothetical protein